jgi:hypothetical protein
MHRETMEHQGTPPVPLTEISAATDAERAINSIGDHMNSKDDTVEIFASLCEIPACERAARLAEIAKRNAGLAVMLEGLLAAFARNIHPTRSLTDLASTTETEIEQQRPPLVTGMKLGDFELLEPIGHGGMGEVWRAEQKSPRRAVALKVVTSTTRRFPMLAGLREREALAAIRHPGIATIYSAGESDGYAWLAVELVEDARDIVTATRDQTIQERVALIADVADAVAHAHAVGFIHRDLKPSNVLMGLDGRPKVIDFGIATTTPRDASATTSSDPLARLGTPAYLPPEAVCAWTELLGATQEHPSRPVVIDARADVRALGVLLYQCVHGTLPAPLTATNTADVLAALATTRLTPPHNAPRETRGDLAEIILRATEANPDERYRTMAAFADDLRAYLASRPVQAAPASAARRVRLAVRRHPRSAFLAVTAITSLILATITSAWYANYARTAALDAAALADQTGTTYGAFIDVFFPRDLQQIQARELTLTEYLRSRITELETRASVMTTKQILAGLEEPARVLQFACLTLGLASDAQRCAILRASIAARLDDANGTQSSTRYFEEALVRLSLDPNDPAALTSLQSLIPAVLSERRILRAAALSRIGGVDYLSDAAVTEKVADLVLHQAPSDPEFALSAMSRYAISTLRTVARGDEVSEKDRVNLARANALLRELAEGGDDAVAHEAILIANMLDLEFCRILAVVCAPHIIPELVECALIAGIPVPSKRIGTQPYDVGLAYSDTLPLRLLRAGHNELCRAYLCELDRRAPSFNPATRRVVEWARAELLLRDAETLEGSEREASIRQAMQIAEEAIAPSVLSNRSRIEEIAAMFAFMGECACELGDYGKASRLAADLRQRAAGMQANNATAEYAAILEDHAALIDGLIEVGSGHLSESATP